MMNSRLIWKHEGWSRSAEGMASWGRAMADASVCLAEGDAAFAAALIEGHSMADAEPLFRAYRLHTPDNSPGLPPHAEAVTPCLSREGALDVMRWCGMDETSAALVLLASGRRAGFVALAQSLEAWAS